MYDLIVLAGYRHSKRRVRGTCAQQPLQDDCPYHTPYCGVCQKSAGILQTQQRGPNYIAQGQFTVYQVNVTLSVQRSAYQVKAIRLLRMGSIDISNNILQSP